MTLCIGQSGHGKAVNAIVSLTSLAAELVRAAIGMQAVQNVASSLLEQQRHEPRSLQWLPVLACWLTLSGM